MAKANQLSRRERQIMDVLYRLEKATVREIMENLSDSPSNSSVRTILRKLEEKGHIKHEEHGLKFVYSPVVGRQRASRLALSNVVQTFFHNSPLMAVNSLLDMSTNEITDEELDRLYQLIQEKKNKKD